MALPPRVDTVQAKQLIDDGVTVIDVLPESIFRQEHLPGARSVPLETFEPSQVDDLDRRQPVIVYCFDQHCDLSARAAARLGTLGFEDVADYVGGRADWTSHGLPTEGSVGDRRRISRYVTEVPTVGIDATIDDVRATVASGDARWPVPVTSAHGVLLGAVAPTATALPGDTPVERVMIPAPGTIRPEMRVDEVVEQLRSDGLDHVFVSSLDGRLLGLVVTAELHV